MKKQLGKIIVSTLLFLLALLTESFLASPFSFWLAILLFLASYLLTGGEVILRAVRNIRGGNVFDENFLMSIATIGAFVIGEYPEGVAVMLFYQVGELFQSYAVNKSRKSIAQLMDIRPEYANVKRGEELVRLEPDEVAVGEIVVIKPGERVPLDGKVLAGYSMVDTTALTGESVPREVGVGDEILSGCINMNGVLTVEVIKSYEDSTVAKILDLVENASSRKSRSEKFITRFAQIYTPVVVIIAALLALIPPLVLPEATFSDWVYRALTFLVVSCPCALVISIPLSFFGGIGGASASGILVKGSNYLEALAKAEVVVFDKTGTLTKGVFKVQEIQSENLSAEKLLELAAYAEHYSNHPISRSLLEAYKQDIDNERIGKVEEIPGHGIVAWVDGQEIMVGNHRLMEKMAIPYYQGELGGTVVHVAVNGGYAGYILIADEVKPDALKTIEKLKLTNIQKTVMLTGDTHEVGRKVAQDLGIDQVYAQLLPGDKVEKLEELLTQKSANGRLVYVGDGINDAPVLARADIGIAMGALGSDAAIEAADIVIMNDEPSKVVTVMKIARKTLGIAQQNAVFAIGIKVAVLILSAIGLATMWEAVFADVGVTVLAILNSFRTLTATNPG